MGRKMDFGNISEEEYEKILKVIEKDFQLRQQETERIGQIQEAVKSEAEKTSVLSNQEKFNNQFCIRCCSAFGFIFNRKQMCLECSLFVCKNCSHYFDSRKGYVCLACIKEKDLSMKTCGWFYTSLSDRFKRFGSAKVVRAMYKYKSESDAESDTELIVNPTLYQALTSSQEKRRPSIRGVFPHIILGGGNGVPSGGGRRGELEKALREHSTKNTKPERRAENLPSLTDAVPDTRKKEIQEEILDFKKQCKDEEFRLDLENMLGEMYQSLDAYTTNDLPEVYTNSRYGDLIVSYREQFKDILAKYSESIQDRDKDGGSVDIAPDEAHDKHKEDLTKIVEDALGEAVDLGSDEAVSDLSSSTDEEGNDHNTSFEEQLAQAMVNKVLDKHRFDWEEREKLQSQLDAEEAGFDYDDHFDKMIKFSQGSGRNRRVFDVVEERLSPIQEAPIERFILAKKDRNSYYDPVSCGGDDPRSPLQNINTNQGLNTLGFNEIDSDMLCFSNNVSNDYHNDDNVLFVNAQGARIKSSDRSLNLNNNNTQENANTNWMLGQQGILSPYENCDGKKVGKDISESIYMHVPQPEFEVGPKIGNEEADNMSELSENNESRHKEFSDGGDDSDNSDKNNSYYADTSRELERVSKRPHRRKTSLTESSVQTDDSEIDSPRSRTSSVQTPTQQSSGHASNSSVQRQISGDGSDDSTKSKDNVKREVMSSQKFQEMSIPAENDDPKFEMPPFSTCAVAGEHINLTCRVCGSEPIDVFWYRADDDDIEQLDDNEKYEITSDSENRFNLTIYNPVSEDEGQYSCVAINEIGRCCQFFTINVKANTQEMKPPEFLRTIEDLDVIEGQRAKFRVKVKGYPPPRVVWYKDGKKLKSDFQYRIARIGNRDYTLSIDYVTMDHDAEYSVIAKNIAGEAKLYAQLIVEPDFIESESPFSASTTQAPITTKKSSTSVSLVSPSVKSPVYSPSERKFTFPSSSSTTSSSTSPSTIVSVDSRKDQNQLTNISEKLTMTRDSVSNVAEEMLTAAGEISQLDQELDEVNQALLKLEQNLDQEEYMFEDTYMDDGGRSPSLSPLSPLSPTYKPVDANKAIDDYHSKKESAIKVRQVTSEISDILQKHDVPGHHQKSAPAHVEPFERRSLRDSWNYREFLETMRLDSQEDLRQSSKVKTKISIGGTGRSQSTSPVRRTRSQSSSPVRSPLHGRDRFGGSQSLYYRSESPTKRTPSPVKGKHESRRLSAGSDRSKIARIEAKDISKSETPFVPKYERRRSFERRMTIMNVNMASSSENLLNETESSPLSPTRELLIKIPDDVPAQTIITRSRPAKANQKNIQLEFGKIKSKEHIDSISQNALATSTPEIDVKRDSIGQGKSKQSPKSLNVSNKRNTDHEVKRADVKIVGQRSGEVRQSESEWKGNDRSRSDNVEVSRERESRSAAPRQSRKDQFSRHDNRDGESQADVHQERYINRESKHENNVSKNRIESQTVLRQDNLSDRDSKSDSSEGRVGESDSNSDFHESQEKVSDSERYVQKYKHDIFETKPYIHEFENKELELSKSPKDTTPDSVSKNKSVTESKSKDNDRKQNDSRNTDHEVEKINLGPKAQETSRFTRDYVVKPANDNTPKRKHWEVKTSSYLSRDEILKLASKKKAEDMNEAEENIYMAAGNVYSLSDRLRDLEAKVKSKQTSPRQMNDLEDEVFRAVAHVEQTEKEVSKVERTVSRIKTEVKISKKSTMPEEHRKVSELNTSTTSDLDFPSKGDMSSSSTSSMLASPSLSVDSGISLNNKINSNATVITKETVKPSTPKVHLVGQTNEDDVPESRSEYNFGKDVPSVHNLKSRFNLHDDDLPESSLKRGAPLTSSSALDDHEDIGNFERVYSITARRVPKEQLERIRRQSSGQISYPVRLPSTEETSPNRPPSLIRIFRENDTDTHAKSVSLMDLSTDPGPVGGRSTSMMELDTGESQVNFAKLRLKFNSQEDLDSQSPVNSNDSGLRKTTSLLCLSKTVEKNEPVRSVVKQVKMKSTPHSEIAFEKSYYPTATHSSVKILSTSRPEEPQSGKTVQPEIHDSYSINQSPSRTSSGSSPRENVIAALSPNATKRISMSSRSSASNVTPTPRARTSLSSKSEPRHAMSDTSIRTSSTTPRRATSTMARAAFWDDRVDQKKVCDENLDNEFPDMSPEIVNRLHEDI